MVDHVISYKQNEQLKFFMVADRFMKNAGEFDDYEEMYAEFDQYLPQALVEVEKAAEPFAAEFAKQHWNDDIHYFVGAGNQWGATYCMRCVIGKSSFGSKQNQSHHQNFSMECLKS